MKSGVAVGLEIGALLCVGLWQPASGAYLTNSVSLNGGAVLRMNAQADGGGSDQSVTRQAGGIWHFGSKNGDTTYDDAVDPAGLDLNAYTLSTSDGVNINLNLNGGSLTGTAATAVTTAWSGGNAGHVTIRNVTDIAIGKINTVESSGVWGQTSGSVTIGESGARAGHIRINALEMYGSVVQSNGGTLTIHGNGDVLIRTAGGVAGGISTDGTSDDGAPGAISIDHRGDFAAATLSARNPRRGKPITIKGGSPGGNSFLAAGLYTYATDDTSWNDTAGPVSVSGYDSITVSGSIWTYNPRTSANMAGSVTVTAADTISIGGSIDTYSGTGGHQPVTLIATNGAIVLGSLNMARVGAVKVSSGGGIASITNVLSNFSGSTTNNLRCPAGQKVYYDPRLPGNSYLNVLTYPLKDWDGVSAGGALEPLPLAAPIVVTKPAQNIGTHSVEMIGYVGSTGTAQTAVYVYWGPGGDQGPGGVWSYTNEVTLEAESGTTYTNPVEALTPAEGYTYRYFVTNAFGGHWGNATSFTNLQCPAVSDVSADNVSWASADLSATVTAGYPSPNLYILVKAGSEPVLDGTNGWDIVISAGVRSGLFATFRQGLQANTTYFCRAWVSNSWTNVWSGATDFTTEPSQPSELVLSNNHTVSVSTAPLTFSNTVARLVRDGASYYSFADLGANPMQINMAGFYIKTDNGANIYLNLNGGSITGSAGVVCLDTQRSDSSATGGIVVKKVGDMTVGRVRTTANFYNVVGNAGSVQIGENTADGKAGRLTLAKIETSGLQRGSSGNITVYGNSDVFVKRHDTGVAGNLETYNACGEIAGYVLVRHNGSFSAANILTYGDGSTRAATTGGNATFDGDLPGDGISGTFVVTDAMKLYQTRTGTSFTRAAGNLTISKYESVVIGGVIECYNKSTAAYVGGSVLITNITGDITIGGAINLYSDRGIGFSGDLSVSCGGTITLAALDLTQVRTAKLSANNGAARGKSHITGAVTGFDSGNTTLRCPPGQNIYYDPARQSDPDLVAGQSYGLKALNGVDDGGWLKPVPLASTVLLFR